MMHMKLLNLVEAFGPLDHSAAQAIIYSIKSIFQVQFVDEFSIVILLPDRALQLDAAAVSSLVDYHEKYSPNSEGMSFFSNILANLRVRPKPEPEVAACKPFVEPEPEPESEAVTPRWRARIRTKTHGGYVHESSEDITDLDELERLVDRNPYYREDIKHIKIKLEPKL